MFRDVRQVAEGGAGVFKMLIRELSAPGVKSEFADFRADGLDGGVIQAV